MGEVLKIVRSIPAPAAVVFDAWLDPEAIGTWMCPGEIFESVATVDARVGGRFEIVMRSPDKDDRHTGRYVEIDRPKRLSFTWRSAGTDYRETLVSVELVAVDGNSCELTLVHSDLPEHQREGHAIGWKAHIRCLITYLGEQRISD